MKRLIHWLMKPSRLNDLTDDELNRWYELAGFHTKEDKMKTYHARYNNGQTYEACKTLTVQELIEKLNAFPPTLPVVAEWEGLLIAIGTGSNTIKVKTLGDVNEGFVEDNEDAVVLTVDEQR